MQAAHFYKNSNNNMRRGAKANRSDVPRLTSTPTVPARGRGRGRGVGTRRPGILQAPPPPAAVNHGIDLDDSDKENEDLDDLDVPVQNNPNVNNADIEEEETQDDFDWKCKLLEILQQYPEVYDLAHPRYKDKDFRDQAWDEIATGMDATGNLLNISPCRSILYQIYAKFCVKRHALIIFSSL